MNYFFKKTTDVSKPPKVILIGDGSTGKTSYFQRICNLNNARYRFNKKYVATEDFNLKILNFKTNLGKINLHLWDTAGQEKYGKDLREAYIKGADCAIIMYDITNKKTIQNIQKWLNDILSVCGNLPVIIVGNKMDRKDNVQSLELVKFRDARLVSMYNGNKNIKNILISVKANTCLQRGRHGDTICENGIIIPIEELLSMYYNVDVKIEL